MGFDKLKERMNGTETQEEEKSGILDQLLAKVDMSAPLEIPMDSGQILTITQEQFISYYLPPDATRAEKAKCFNETRAAGLNPAIRGDCHFFKTGGGPLSLFVGYHVYVRKAYANGLNHIHKPELVYDKETGALDSCIITLEIEGRPEFIWETWLSEVVAERNGQPNSRWQKAERQMLIKCSVTNTFRMAGIASIGILPPTMDEMPDFSAPGYKNLTQEQLAAHDIEPADATPGEVTASTHQIDLSPLRRNYRGKIAEREIFTDDTQRKMWQSEIIGKASTTDWGAEDFMNAVSEIESGRCELWVQDNKPKPDPESPKGAKPEDATGADANLEAMPDMPPKPTFLAEGEKRFADIKDFEAWCKERISPLPWDEWTDANFEVALPRLLEVPLLAAQDATNEPTQPEPQAKQEKEQASVPAPLSAATKESIKQALEAFGDRRYQTIKSLSFKARAAEAIERDVDTIGISELTEDEGLIVLESLKAERKEQLEKIAEAEKFKEALTTGTLADDDPLNQGEVPLDEDGDPLEDGMPRFCDTPEWKELHNAYFSRLKAHLDAAGKPVFASVDEQSLWESAVSGQSSIIHWSENVFDAVHNALDRRGVERVGETTPNTPATAEEPVSDGNCTDDDFKELGLLFTELLPDKQYAMGSTQARDLIRESKAVNGIFTRIKNLSTAEVSDLKLFLNDKISDMKADAAERAKNAAPA